MGRCRERLKKMLLKLGFDVEFFALPQGWYRTNTRADVYRWEAWATHPVEGANPGRVHLYSWSTMTDCLRHGIDTKRDQRDGSATFEVTLREARK